MAELAERQRPNFYSCCFRVDVCFRPPEQTEWNMKDISSKDGEKIRAPLMVWDIAVNSMGIAYFTTYVQVRLVRHP